VAGKANRWAALARRNGTNMNNITYEIDAGNNIHIVIGEYTLCGVAWDELGLKDTHKRVVDCPDCAAIVQQLRHVRVRRPTTGAVDVATIIENNSVVSPSPRH
jgi:hypothetical protein